MLGEFIFLTPPLGRQHSGLEEQLDICVLCVCAYVYTPTGRTCSGSLSSLDLGTGNCSSHTEAQTVTSPWPCTSLEHSAQGSAGVSAPLKFLCHLLSSSWLVAMLPTECGGHKTPPLRLISPSRPFFLTQGQGDLSRLGILGAAHWGRCSLLLSEKSSSASTVSSRRKWMLRPREILPFLHSGKNFKNSDAS